MADAQQQHARGVDLAYRTGDDLQALIDRLGHVDAPGGRIYAAYRTARRALEGRTQNKALVRDTLATLRQAVTDAADATLSKAHALGLTRAEANLALYNVRPAPASASAPNPVDNWFAAWLALYEAQAAAAQAFAGTSTDAVILGDRRKPGVLTPGPIARIGAQALVAVALASFSGAVTTAARRGGVTFYKQAVAAIDERTTDCCLKVHGQVQPLDAPFHLTGTPRYADEVMDPPFHWYCRSAEALVTPDQAEDALSRQMRDAATRELGARDVTETRKVIHPANAYSRRG